MRRHPRPILRPAQTVRVRRVPARSQLHLLRRLRRQRQAVARDHLPAAGLQNKVPGELLFAQRQPRVRVDQPDLRLLRRVQAQVQHQAVEDLHRLLQLPARRGHHRRKDFLHARRPVARAQQHGADPQNHEADRRARHRAAVRPAVVRPRERHQRLGGKRQRRQLRVRPRHRQRFLEKARPGPDLTGPPGRRRRLRVLCKETARHAVFGAELLRRVRQQRRDDVRGRDLNVQFPDSEAGREEAEVQLRRHGRGKTSDAAEIKVLIYAQIIC